MYVSNLKMLYIFFYVVLHTLNWEYCLSLSSPVSDHAQQGDECANVLGQGDKMCRACVCVCERVASDLKLLVVVGALAMLSAESDESR